MKTTSPLAWKLGLFISMASLSNLPAQTASKDVASPAPPVEKKTPLKLSAWTKEIVKLAQARIDEEVMLSFVDNSGTFNLGADQIIHLNAQGVPPMVVDAMLRHDQEIIAGLRTLTISSDPGYEPLLELKLVTTTNAAPAAPLPQPAAVKPSLPSLPPKTEIAVIPEAVPIAEASSTIATPAVVPVTAGAASTIKPPAPPVSYRLIATPAKKKQLYPVRPTQAEELLPPILVVKAVTRTPNVFIIEGFPPE